jgi:hypothetical protein
LLHDAALRKFLHCVRFEAAHVRSEAECARIGSQARIALRARCASLRTSSEALRMRWQALGTISPALRTRRAPLRAQSKTMRAQD